MREWRPASWPRRPVTRSAIGVEPVRSLASVPDGVADAPLPTVVQLWTLDAELASEAGDGERALSLVTRALRAAHREELRSALSPVSPWLAACVNRHPDLSREHRAFLSSMAAPALPTARSHTIRHPRR